MVFNVQCIFPTKVCHFYELSKVENNKHHQCKMGFLFNSRTRFFKTCFSFGMLDKPFSPKNLLVLWHKCAFFSFLQKPTHLLPSLSPSSLCKFLESELGGFMFSSFPRPTNLTPRFILEHMQASKKLI